VSLLLNASEVPAARRLSAGYVVKSACEDVWSGSGPGDPENPALGRECVDSLAKAHVFRDIDEAEAEASTYRGGAHVVPVEMAS
jgi:hypothetical protein